MSEELAEIQRVLNTIIFAVFLIAGLCLLANRIASHGRNSDGEWKTISHPQYDFSVTYPSRWHASTYGEHGFKGEESIKLYISPDRHASAIVVRRRAAANPTLEDVVKWRYYSRIYNRLENHSSYEEVYLREFEIDEHPVAVRQYKSGNYMYEDVHIARSNDIIVVTLEGEISDFETLHDEFDRIVKSFSPME